MAAAPHIVVPQGGDMVAAPRTAAPQGGDMVAEEEAPLGGADMEDERSRVLEVSWFGPVRDVYLPKDYYSGEPRGFAFVEFVDPYDASEAQYHMNRQVFFGREITVVLAAESRKRPEDMRTRTRVRGYSGGHEGRRSSHYGRSRSRSRSASPRPRGGGRARSRSYSPAPRRRDDYSASPRGRESHRTKSPVRHPKEHEEDKRRSYSPPGRDGDQRDADNGYEKELYRAEHQHQILAVYTCNLVRPSKVLPCHCTTSVRVY
uniref:35 kDa SR repressor protein n=1 Tax=Aegilops tauschii TaxID=37682 RepID=M8BQL1_AEGTA